MTRGAGWRGENLPSPQVSMCGTTLCSTHGYPLWLLSPPQKQRPGNKTRQPRCPAPSLSLCLAPSLSLSINCLPNDLRYPRTKQQEHLKSDSLPPPSTDVRLPTSSYPPILASTPSTPPAPAPAVFGRALCRVRCPISSFPPSSPSPLGTLPSFSPRAAPRSFVRELGPEDSGRLRGEPFQVPSPVVCGLTPDFPAPPPPRPW